MSWRHEVLPKRSLDTSMLRQKVCAAFRSRREYHGLTHAVEYFVKSLPEVPQSFMTEMYSGLIPIEEGDPNRALFFVFQPRVGPPVDEVTIWMNGGPGCSSLEGKDIIHVPNTLFAW